jgi:hypothetical protein
MSERVSIKGQGADIFFREDAGEQAGPRSESHNTPANHKGGPHDSLVSGKSKPASQPADQPVSQQASLPARQHASLQAPLPQHGEFTLSESTKRRLRDLLYREHRTHNTYRYHDDELSAVRDIVYELEVRWGVKASRNDVMRAILLWAIDDYAQQGEKSLLVELLREEGRP